ncbi:MAG: hemerythrin family protein [Nitrospirae bacterium]|nr:hemerythrin family protein [Nitrospirota bacterium]
MALITWSSSMSVKVKEFDEHHQKLVKLLNNMHDAVEAKKGNDVIEKVLNELISYTRYHFAAEEKMFDTHKYPGTPKQKQAHADFTKKLLDFQAKFKSGNAIVDILLMNFLKSWLTTHIMGDDKQYGPFFNSKGVS